MTIANAVRAMLIGANLPVKFLPYAFHHYLHIANSIPSRDQDKAPITLVNGKVDDFSDFRTFGCRVHVRVLGRPGAKLKDNTCKGLFLGFLPNTHRVKIAKQAQFD